MSDEARRRGLGRGLSALMADIDAPAEPSPAGARMLPIEALRRNAEQPRRSFDPEQITDLAESIKAKGILQPIIVRTDPVRPDQYQIVAGERRWRAAQQANLHEVPAIVRDLSDRDVLEIAIIENVQRVDLDPLEEAVGFQQLIDRFGHTQEQVAKGLGKSRSHVANALRLLNLPPVVQGHLRGGRISAGHARAILSADDPEALAERVIKKGLSVRETERASKAASTPKAGPRAASSRADADTRALEDDLSAAVGSRVRIAHRSDGTGVLSIQYGDPAALDQLCEALSRAGRDRAAR